MVPNLIGFTRASIGSVALGLSAAWLSSCQFDPVPDPNPVLVTADISLTQEWEAPDELTWRTTDTDHPAGLSGNGKTIVATINLSTALNNNDTVWVSLWTAGVRSSEISYSQQPGQSKLKLIEIKADAIALALLEQIQLPGQRTPDTLRLNYAKALVDGDPVFKGFPQNCPVGIDTGTLLKVAISYAISKKMTLPELARTWLLGIDTASVHARVRVLVETGAIANASDTLGIFSPPPVWATALAIDTVLARDAAIHVVNGVFTATSGLVGNEVQIFRDSKNVSDSFLISNRISTLGQPLKLDLAKALSIQVRPTTAAGSYRLQVTMDDGTGHHSATASVFFRVTSLSDPTVPVIPLPSLVPNGGSFTSIQTVTVTAAGADSIQTSPDSATWTTYRSALTISESQKLFSRSFLAGTASEVVVVSFDINTAPTLSGISDLSVEPGMGRSTRSFQVADDQTAAKDLVVTAQSDNPGLAPLDSISFGASLDQNRTVQVTPVAGKYGIATITLSVADARKVVTTASWRLTVNPPASFQNMARAASIRDRDTTLTFSLSPDTAHPHVLSVSNPALLPVADSQLVLTGKVWGLRLHPRLHGDGTSVVVLQTKRGTVASVDTFFVSVTPINTAPQIDAVADWRGLQGSAAAKIGFKIRDDLTIPSGLVVTATATNPSLFQLTVGTGDSARILTLTPQAGAVGSTQITIKVTDSGSLVATRTFNATLVHINHAPQFNILTTGPLVVRSYHDTFGVALASIPSWGDGDGTQSGQFQIQYLAKSDSGLFVRELQVDASGRLKGRAPLDTLRTIYFKIRLKDNGGTADGGVDTSDWSGLLTLQLIDTVMDAQANIYQVQRMPDRKVWMRTNLRTVPSWFYPGESATYYGPSTANISYGWSQAMDLPRVCDTTNCASQLNSPHRGLCPKGWHIPSHPEWSQLFVAAGVVAGDSAINLRDTSSWQSYNRGGPNGDMIYTYTPSNNRYRNFLVAHSMNGGSGYGVSGEVFVLPKTDATGKIGFLLEMDRTNISEVGSSFFAAANYVQSLRCQED